MLGKCAPKTLAIVTAVCGVLIWLRNIFVWLFDQQNINGILSRSGSTVDAFIRSGFGSGLYTVGRVVANVVVWLVGLVLVWVAYEMIYRIAALYDKNKGN